jgi:hypothetical protein
LQELALHVPRTLDYTACFACKLPFAQPLSCKLPLHLLLPLQDPSIKQMAEQIANDPSFQGLTAQLQESMAGMMGAMGGAAGAEGGAAAAAAGAGGMPGRLFSHTAWQDAERLTAQVWGCFTAHAVPHASSTQQAVGPRLLAMLPALQHNIKIHSPPC